MISGCEVAGKYVRAFAHVQRHVPSTVRAGPNKASEMAQQGTKRVRTAMAEDQETQVFSPTKRVRSEPTREEEEEEDDDDLDMSGSQDVDASQLCTQGEMIGIRNSEFVSKHRLWVEFVICRYLPPLPPPPSFTQTHM